MGNNINEILDFSGSENHINNFKVEEYLRIIEDFKNKFLSFAKNVPFSIIVFSENDDVLYINPKFHEIFGYSAEEITSKSTLFEKTLPNIDYRKLVLSKIKNESKKMKEVSDILMDIKMLMNSGVYKEMDLKIINIKNGEKIYFFEDLTERIKTEKQRIKLQRLETLNNLIGGIFHDFNNILVGISGNIDLIRRFENNLAEKSSLCLERMEKAVFDASKLSHELFKLSNSDESVKDFVDIEEILKESLIISFIGTSCEYKLHINDDLPKIFVDYLQLKQVFNNIILNAIQSMPFGGLVEIFVKKIKCLNADESKKEMISIEVRDNGIGIPEIYHNKIFQPYFTTKPDGNGLGLSTSYSIIKKHGGHIEFKSKYKIGTSFFIYLPVSNEQISETNDENIEVKFNGRVLVMDDQEYIQELMRSLLEELGLEVDIVERGEIAIKKYLESMSSGQKYDLLILDLILPNSMGGTEVLKKIIEFDPDVNALAFSGYLKNSEFSKYKNMGFKSILKKPFRIEKLREVLKNILPYTTL